MTLAFILNHTKTKLHRANQYQILVLRWFFAVFWRCSPFCRNAVFRDLPSMSLPCPGKIKAFQNRFLRLLGKIVKASHANYIFQSASEIGRNQWLSLAFYYLQRMVPMGKSANLELLTARNRNIRLPAGSPDNHWLCSVGVEHKLLLTWLLRRQELRRGYVYYRRLAKNGMSIVRAFTSKVTAYSWEKRKANRIWRVFLFLEMPKAFLTFQADAWKRSRFSLVGKR